MAAMIDPKKLWLNRAEAAAYLSERGLPISGGTLSNLAANKNRGDGPAYHRRGWRTVRYHVNDLNAWLKQKLERVE